MSLSGKTKLPARAILKVSIKAIFASMITKKGNENTRIIKIKNPNFNWNYFLPIE
jgi:hypothetical protein